MSSVQFGTAGIRGRLGDGPGEINAALMRRIGAGLAAHLHTGGSAIPARAVVGHDARHGSEHFAAEAAAALAGAGISTWLLPEALPTPVLAFAVRALGAGAGVMVTASHNPAEDNGAKVYGADGVQILPDAATAIADAIDAVPAEGEVPRGPVQRLGPEIVERYLEAILAATDLGPLPPPLRVVYTPLHGVGLATLRRAFTRAGLGSPTVLASQATPDPEFPTARRPNPEDPDVLGPALTLARETGADLLLANDPDADRLAVAVPDPGVAGGWRVLSGDEIGILLADRLIPDPAGPEDLAVTTIVSSGLLAKLARARGASFTETLTGFKWIMHAAADPHRQLRIGYEEALGFGVSTAVGDKDGISAALVVARIAGELAAQGSSPVERLDELARRFGLHATAQRTIALEARADGGEDDPATRALERLRTQVPRAVAGVAITAVDDFAAGVRHHRDGRGKEPLGLPPTPALILRGGDSLRVAVRPSGTEPKLKVYLERVLEVPDGDVASARAAAAGELSRVAEAILAIIAP